MTIFGKMSDYTGALNRINADTRDDGLPENSLLTLGKLDGQEFARLTPVGGSVWLL